MPAHRVSDRLRQELAMRRAKNARYSLRAFAARLEVDHATLSQILRDRRPAPAARIHAWSRTLGWDREEALAYAAAEQARDSAWAAEAMSVAGGAIHWDIVRLCNAPDFRADCRWIAERARVPVDEVNIALSRLLRLGLLEMHGPAGWKYSLGPAPASEPEFRRIALAQVRQRTPH